MDPVGSEAEGGAKAPSLERNPDAGADGDSEGAGHAHSGSAGGVLLQTG